MTRVLVYGLGIAGTSVARALVARGHEVVLADDQLTRQHELLGKEIGAEIFPTGDLGALAALVKSVDSVMPAPGVPETHPLFAISVDAQKEMLSEIELAYRWEQLRSGGPRPILAVTGTDGKTTTTLMAAAMIHASGKRVAAVGNTETPFIDALDSDAEAFVVECSSFRLTLTSAFRANAATWLNIAPDHLDWHRDFASYVAAKAKIWAHMQPGDAVVAPSAHQDICAIARQSAGRFVSFGDSSDSNYFARGNELVGPQGVLLGKDTMKRSLPHDVQNGLAAAAMCLESGVGTWAGVVQALQEFEPSHHRIELVAIKDDVRWFDDSKATSPHAARTALRAFPQIVLIAGGRNKGLDLSELALEHEHVKAVVCIGESADDIAAAFAGLRPTVIASSMQEAIEIAGSLVSANEVVLLSPACTSFDWYKNYEERGIDFATRVKRYVGQEVPHREGEGRQ
jgi:UDP-N-acetylmuramoylalanine--D-glutamate ligase